MTYKLCCGQISVVVYSSSTPASALITRRSESPRVSQVDVFVFYIRVEKLSRVFSLQTRSEDGSMLLTQVETQLSGRLRVKLQLKVCVCDGDCSLSSDVCPSDKVEGTCRLFSTNKEELIAAAPSFTAAAPKHHVLTADKTRTKGRSAPGGRSLSDSGSVSIVTWKENWIVGQVVSLLQLQFIEENSRLHVVEDTLTRSGRILHGRTLQHDVYCRGREKKKLLPAFERDNKAPGSSSAAAECCCGLEFALVCMIKSNCVTPASLRLHSGFTPPAPIRRRLPLDPSGTLSGLSLLSTTAPVLWMHGAARLYITAPGWSTVTPAF
ncbi:unnamed protein product [Pleuronectes platessa]|uniref:Uncharacterized protein n=1 Tax=Pleuronectes platessa TaxID=8262 RepID=A0A9N7UXS1_PLEPL|nr:unnamed protein product [Pleuronectes platessa]